VPNRTEEGQETLPAVFSSKEWLAEGLGNREIDCRFYMHETGADLVLDREDYPRFPIASVRNLQRVHGGGAN
jgi:hypothetical protein